MKNRALFGGSIITALCLAGAIVGYSAYISHVHAVDLKSYKQQLLAQQQKISESLKNQTLQYAPPPAPTPKPQFTVHAIAPLPNGTWQIPWIDHGPYHVSDMWLVDYHQGADGVWNDVYVFSGVLASDPTHGVIGEFTLNESGNHVWDVPSPVNGAVHIASVNGDTVTYSTSNGTGHLNLKTGQFN